jgi:cytochrome c oxidase cbb3-type subunit III
MTRAHRAALGAAMLLAAACRGTGEQEGEAPPSAGERVFVAAGELQAGPSVTHLDVRNPLEQDPAASADGRRLFVWYNCAGCHGMEGGGAIGPPLRDADWIYGSDPASVFQSIAQGRPNGMPAFGVRIPDEQIWRIEMFIRTLGKRDTVVRAGGSSGQSPTEAQKVRSGG